MIEALYLNRWQKPGLLLFTGCLILNLYPFCLRIKVATLVFFSFNVVVDVMFDLFEKKWTSIAKWMASTAIVFDLSADDGDRYVFWIWRTANKTTSVIRSKNKITKRLSASVLAQKGEIPLLSNFMPSTYRKSESGWFSTMQINLFDHLNFSRQVFSKNDRGSGKQDVHTQTLRYW